MILNFCVNFQLHRLHRRIWRRPRMPPFGAAYSFSHFFFFGRLETTVTTWTFSFLVLLSVCASGKILILRVKTQIGNLSIFMNTLWCYLFLLTVDRLFYLEMLFWILIFLCKLVIYFLVSKYILGFRFPLIV